MFFDEKFILQNSFNFNNTKAVAHQKFFRGPQVEKPWSKLSSHFPFSYFKNNYFQNKIVRSKTVQASCLKNDHYFV